MAASQTTEGPLIDGTKTLVRVTAFFRKKQGMSDEEFDKYWAETHGPLLANLPIVKEKLVKYSQFHLSAEHKEKLVSVFGADSWISEYDASADMWAKDVESFIAMFTDEQLFNFSSEDGKKFIEGPAKLMIGYDHIQLDRTSSSQLN